MSKTKHCIKNPSVFIDDINQEIEAICDLINHEGIDKHQAIRIKEELMAFKECIAEYLREEL